MERERKQGAGRRTRNYGRGISPLGFGEHLWYLGQRKLRKSARHFRRCYLLAHAVILRGGAIGITHTLLSVQHSHEPNEITACVDESKVSCGRDGLSVCLSFILFSEGVSDTNIFFAFGVGQGPGARRIHGSFKTTWFTIPRRFPRLGCGGALCGPGLPTRLF